jgi:biopolymer transport protein ExbD
MRRFRIDEDININITPLIDIMFILLLFLVLTTTFDINQIKSIDLQLPEATTAANSETTTFFNVLVTAKDEVLVGSRVLSLEELSSEIKTAFGNDPSLKAAILADKNATHGTVVSILDIFRTHKVLDVNIQATGK